MSLSTLSSCISYICFRILCPLPQFHASLMLVYFSYKWLLQLWHCDYRVPPMHLPVLPPLFFRSDFIVTSNLDLSKMNGKIIARSRTLLSFSFLVHSKCSLSCQFEVALIDHFKMLSTTPESSKETNCRNYLTL